MAYSSKELVEYCRTLYNATFSAPNGNSNHSKTPTTSGGKNLRKSLLLPSVILMTSLVLSSCQTITTRPGGGAELETEPSFEQRQSFWWWGLTPSARFVNVEQICNNAEPLQMQTQNRALDSFLGIITLGIYAPRTAKVWCPEAPEKLATDLQTKGSQQ